jgi:uncharacterized OB-fold protein
LQPLAPLGSNPSKPTKPESLCPFCNSEVNPEATYCPNCFHSLDSKSTSTGKIVPHTPDPQKPKTPQPDKNVPLAAGVYFDSRTKRFIIASETEDKGDHERRRHMKKHFPKQKPMPRTKPEMTGREFKQVPKPSFTQPVNQADEISDTCNDLAIDG